MPNVSLQVFEALRFLLDATRFQIERASTGRPMYGMDEDAFLEMALQIEPLRFKLNMLDIRRSSSSEVQAVIVDLINRFDRVLSIEMFRAIGDDIAWNPPRAMLNRINKNFPDLLSETQVVDGYPLTAALSRYISFLHFYISDNSRQTSLFEDSQVEQLRQILPDQNISPVRFDISNNKIVVSHQQAISLKKDARSVDEARRALTESGNRIVDELKRSNCDIRMLHSVQEIQDILSSEQDIIRLGLRTTASDALRSAFKDELPEALNALLIAQSININLYVSQFPEWQRFAEQAERVNVE